MIIRKPSRIELKRENDLDDYNQYKKQLEGKRLNQRNLMMMEENPQMSFLTPNPIRNRDKMICESDYRSPGAGNLNLMESHSRGDRRSVDSPQDHHDQIHSGYINFLLNNVRETPGSGGGREESN